MKKCFLAIVVFLCSCVAIKPKDNERLPIRSLSEYLEPFSKIPDSNVTCYMHVYIMFASAKHPGIIWDPLTGAIGHAFMAIEKFNIADTATRYFGLYPEKGVPNIFSGKLVGGELSNNAHHRYNVSFKTKLSPFQLRTVISKLSLSGEYRPFSIYQHNCVDFVTEMIKELFPGFDPYRESRKHRLLPGKCLTPEDLNIALGAACNFEKEHQ